MTIRVGLGVAALLAAVLSGCATSPGTQGSASFAVIGDLGYSPAYEAPMQRVLDDINRTPLAFVVHLGDLSVPSFGCDDAFRAKRLAQFQASVHPFVFTPGDNDWTDCHEQHGVKGHTAEERLSDLRRRFFPQPRTLGQQSFPLVRQSDSGDPDTARYVENARWSHAGVTFITVHTVGSNNNRGRNPTADAEYADRMRANDRWLAEGFKHARTSGARAVMILTQANPFYGPALINGRKEPDPSGFAELRALLEREARTFDRPIMFVHGDTHYFRIDKPLGRGTPKPGMPALEHFTRVEAFGQPDHHWLQITIDPDDPAVFTVRQRIVAENIVNR